MTTVEQNAKENLKVMRDLVRKICTPEFAVYLDVEANTIEVYNRFLGDGLSESLGIETVIFKETALLSEELFCSVAIVAESLLNNTYICDMDVKPVCGNMNSMMIAALYLSNSSVKEWKTLSAKIFRELYDEVYTATTIHNLPSSTFGLLVLSMFTDIGSRIMVEALPSTNINTFLNPASNILCYDIKNKITKIKEGFNFVLATLDEHNNWRNETVSTTTLYNKISMFMASRGVDDYDVVPYYIMAMLLFTNDISMEVKADIIKSLLRLGE